MAAKIKKALGTEPKLIHDGRGIFDVVVEDELVYSKFKTGSFPDEKIESSEMTRSMVPKYRQAMEQLNFIRDIAYVHMDRVESPDLLVIMADFFLNIVEIEWSIVSGVYKNKLIVILRNAGFHGDAGKTAKDLFEGWKGSAGGHRNAARAEIPLQNILDFSSDESGLGAFVKTIIKRIK